MRNHYLSVRAIGKTVITAHSGCENTRPNSREHILAAIASQAEMMEVDVRRQGDLFYLSHDLPEEPEKCVTLRECLQMAAVSENLCLNLDVKTEGLPESVMAIAEECGMAERIVFTGACNKDRALALSLKADMWRSLWQGDSVDEALSAIKKDGSPYLNVWYPMITAENHAMLRENGFDFSAWTVDTEEEIRKFLTMGIANITTRHPVLAMSLRKEIQGI